MIKSFISKFYDLEIEIEKMQHFKTNTMPVKAGVLRMVNKWRDKCVNKISNCHRLYKVSKVSDHSRG